MPQTKFLSEVERTNALVSAYGTLAMAGVLSQFVDLTTLSLEEYHEEYYCMLEAFIAMNWGLS